MSEGVPPTSEHVCVLIPTLDEEQTISKVITGFQSEGFENILVVDGGSEDETQVVASEEGARVIEQSGSGKGAAVQEAVSVIDAPFILMIDGDATYNPKDAHKLINRLENGADHVIGDRYGEMDKSAMPKLNGVGNKLINTTFRRIYDNEFNDILSGYRAFTRESLSRVTLTKDGFGIETEIAIEYARHDFTTDVVPVEYTERPEDSESNLNPVTDGGRIFMTLYALSRWSNPLFYFGSLGALSWVIGTAIATFVGYEWFLMGISHEGLTVVSSFFLLMGLLVMMFGLLSDMVVRLHDEQKRELSRIEQKLTRED